MYTYGKAELPHLPYYMYMDAASSLGLAYVRRVKVTPVLRGFALGQHLPSAMELAFVIGQERLGDQFPRSAPSVHFVNVARVQRASVPEGLDPAQRHHLGIKPSRPPLALLVLFLSCFVCVALKICGIQ